MTSTLRIVIGIATAGRRDQVGLTLQQLARQRQLPERVILCPASPDDFDPTHAAYLTCPVQLVHGPRGSTFQRNAIIEAAADADVLLFLDDDFYPAIDYLEHLEALFAAEPAIVVATGHPKLDGASGPGITHDNAVSAIDAMEKLSPSPEACVPTYGGYGCNLAVRMDPVRQHGVVFDENLPLYGWLEDIDFSRRLSAYGRVVACAELRGVHLATKKGRTSGIRLGYSQVANPIYLARKGTVDSKYAYHQLIKNLTKNLLLATFPEPWVDRRGRLKGNLLALIDLFLSRLEPRNVLQISPEEHTAPTWSPSSSASAAQSALRKRQR